MPRSTTPSFITELPLIVTPEVEQILLVRLEAGRQLYNAVLGEAKIRVGLIKQSKLFQYAKTLPKMTAGKPNPERKEAFQQAWKLYDFSDYALQKFSNDIRKSCWIGEHIDADSAQKLGTRAFKAARNLLLKRAKRVRFKGRNQMDSLEGKSKRSPMKWKDGAFVWAGVTLQALIKRNDPVILHGLNSPVKYVRLVRRKIGGKNRFYVQLVNQGKPFQKDKNQLGAGLVGLDIGPSTLAIVGDNEAVLTPFCSALKEATQKVARLQRQMSRQQRANNPDCFEPDWCDLPKSGQKHGKRKRGKAIKGKRQTQRSNTYQKVRIRKAEADRKLAAHRKSLQNQLVNDIRRMGDVFKLEKLSYRAFQKLFGKSVGKRAPGMFVAQLKQKAETAGGFVDEFPTRDTKLSQRCICGLINKKTLSQREHRCECGVYAQRDLFSGFLARHVDESHCYQAEAALAEFHSLDAVLLTAWKQAEQRYNQSSIGNLREVKRTAASAPERVVSESISHSLEMAGQSSKTLDVVGKDLFRSREPGRG